MILTELSTVPIKKQGKQKGEFKNVMVSIQCDKCQINFAGKIMTFINNENHYCCSCRQVGRKLPPWTEEKMKNNPTYQIYWLSKGYTIEETRKIMKERFPNKIFSKKNNPNCLEYHIEKGYSFSESEELRQDSLKNSLYKSRLEGIPQNVLTKEYWIYKGYSSDDAKKLALDSQYKRLSVRDNKKIGKKVSEYYRNPENKEIIKVRSEKISKALTLLDGTHSPIFKEYWEVLGFSKEDAVTEARKIRMSGGNGSFSYIERECLTALQEILSVEFEFNKYITCNGNFYAPDAKYNNVLFEFFGTNVHLDSRKFSNDTVNPFGKTSKTVYERDEQKINDYLQSNYNVYIIWENDYKNNKENLFNFLKEDFKNEGYKKRKLWNSTSLLD